MLSAARRSPEVLLPALRLPEVLFPALRLPEVLPLAAVAAVRGRRSRPILPGDGAGGAGLGGAALR